MLLVYSNLNSSTVEINVNCSRNEDTENAKTTREADI